MCFFSLNKFLSAQTHAKYSYHKKSREHKKSFGGDGYAYYLDGGDGITGVCLCPDSSNGTH